MPSVAIISLATALMIPVCTGNSERCPPGTYHDPVSGRCDSCADICLNARAQGTEEHCQQSCPDYNLPKVIISTLPNCPRGQYYDPVISRCDSCSTVCDNYKQQGTEENCKQTCPDYFKDKHKFESESLSYPNTAIVIGVTLAGLLIIAVSVYGVAVIRCAQRLPSCLRIERCLPCIFKVYKTPVECTEASTPSSGSSHSINPVQQEQCTVLLNDHDILPQCQSHRDENNT